ncbi:MAG: hypothetical protein ACK4F9_05700 [Brevinematia bacterium]
MSLDVDKEIHLIEFVVQKEVFGNFWSLKTSLKSESDEVILGLSLMKSGYVLPGLRILCRNLSIDNARKVFSEVILTPKDFANIFLQLISLNDVKLIRFANSLGIFNNLDNIVGLDVREVVLNGITDDIISTKFLYNHQKYYLSYYVDNNKNIVVLLNGIRFALPKEVITFVGNSNFSINLKSVFNFGFPNERVFFEIRKDISDEDKISYFDPMLKIDFLMSKLEANKFIDFFFELVYLISTDFELINRPYIKRTIIEYLKRKNLTWLLLELKNLVSFLYNQDPTTTLRKLNKNIEMFLSNHEYDIVFRNDKIKILTPVIDVNKYLGDCMDYIRSIGNTEVILVSVNNEIKVFLRRNSIPIGRINPNTSRLISELGGIIASSNLVINESLQYDLPMFFKLWVEIDIIRV